VLVEGKLKKQNTIWPMQRREQLLLVKREVVLVERKVFKKYSTSWRKVKKKYNWSGTL